MIFNRARVIYNEPEGGQAIAVTRTVVVTVIVVNGVTVTPDESESSGLVETNERVTARFEVCNTGNNPLPFVVSQASVTWTRFSSRSRSRSQSACARARKPSSRRRARKQDSP